MATLTNTKIKDTYDGLLKTTNAEAIGASGVTLIEDGLGNASALSVGRSGNGVTITGSLNATLATAAQTNITSVGTLSSLAVSGDVSIADKIIHTGDTNTAIRFPSADTVTVETGGSERMRIDASGNVSIASGILELAAQAKIIGSSDNLQISADPNNVSGASTIEFLVDGSERMRINSSGNVGIGSSSPSTTIHVNSGATNEVATFESTDSTAIVIIKDNTAKTELLHSGANFSIQVDPDNTGAASSFIINMDGTEKLRMHPQYLRLASGTGGIQFNGDTAAANALDDYEEGTWTTTFSTTTNLTGTPVLEDAKYTKIGNLVYCEGRISGISTSASGVRTIVVFTVPFSQALSSVRAIGSVFVEQTQESVGVVNDAAGGNNNQFAIIIPADLQFNGAGGVAYNFSLTYRSA
jgi:hypothetical protein